MPSFFNAYPLGPAVLCKEPKRKQRDIPADCAEDECVSDGVHRFISATEFGHFIKGALPDAPWSASNDILTHPSVVFLICKVVMLLQFLNCLRKCFVNDADGSALLFDDAVFRVFRNLVNVRFPELLAALAVLGGS